MPVLAPCTSSGHDLLSTALIFASVKLERLQRKTDLVQTSFYKDVVMCDLQLLQPYKRPSASASLFQATSMWSTAEKGLGASIDMEEQT